MSVLTGVAGALRYGGGCDLLNSNAQVRQPAALTNWPCCLTHSMLQEQQVHRYHQTGPHGVVCRHLGSRDRMPGCYGAGG
jgi:hypothetical protein